MALIDDFTPEQIQEFANESRSLAELREKIGYAKNGGGTNDIVRSYIKKHGIDTSHMLGQGWSKNVINYDLFQEGKSVKSDVAIRALKILRGSECEICHGTIWNNQPIPLCVHHLNGNHLDNRLENLQLLCPNCHAQTYNYCGKNIKKKNTRITDEQLVEALKASSSIRQALLSLGVYYSARSWYERCYALIEKYDIEFIQKTPKYFKKNDEEKSDSNKKHSQAKQKSPRAKQKPKPKKIYGYCPICNKPLYNKDRKFCSQECSHISLTKLNKEISREELKQMIRTMSFLAIGKELGVSDNAIRKWCKKYDLPYKKKDINSYSDEEWEKL